MSTPNQPTCKINLPCESVTCVNPSACTNYNNEAKCGYQSATDPSVFTCATGYQGSLCNTTIDNCSPDPCDATGSASCTNSVGAFTCNCNTGYRGNKCSQPPQYITTVTNNLKMTITGFTQTIYNSITATTKSTISTAIQTKLNAQYASDANYVTGSYSNFATSFDASLPGLDISFTYEYISSTSGTATRKRRSLTSSESSTMAGLLSSVASDPSLTSAVSSDPAVQQAGLTPSTPAPQTVAAAKVADVDACVFLV